MIPAGWKLVPIIPTERMLAEFSGVWWPHVDRDELRGFAKRKRLLEEESYAAMLAAVPSAPTEETSAIEALQALVKAQRKKAKQLEWQVRQKEQRIRELSQELHRQRLAANCNAPGREEAGVQVGTPGRPAAAVRAGVPAAMAAQPEPRCERSDET